MTVLVVEKAGWPTGSPNVNSVFRLMFIRPILSPETFRRHGVFSPRSNFELPPVFSRIAGFVSARHRIGAGQMGKECSTLLTSFSSVKDFAIVCNLPPSSVFAIASPRQVRFRRDKLRLNEAGGAHGVTRPAIRAKLIRG